MMTTYQTWHVDVSCSIDGNFVVFTCGDTMKPIAAEDWLRPFETYRISLDDLSDELMQTICPDLEP